MSAAIIEGIITAANLATAIMGMGAAASSGSTAPPTGAITDSNRWLTVTVFNQTQFDLVYLAGSTYFDSGRFYTAPTNVSPFESMTFSASSSDGSYKTGVSGGVVFQLQMPSSGTSDQTQDVAIGFTNPEWGSYKTYVMFGNNADTAETNATNKSVSATSQNFSGVDTNEQPVQINFLAASSPGPEASITITQQYVSGS